MPLLALTNELKRNLKKGGVWVLARGVKAQ